MKFLTKLFAFLQPQPATEPTPPALCLNDEFLDVVMEQARKRTRAEQASQSVAVKPLAGPGK